MKTIKIKTIDGAISIYKNCLEFCYGKSYLVLVLLDRRIFSIPFPIEDIISFELKGLDGSFKRVDITRVRKRLQRKHYERSTTYN